MLFNSRYFFHCYYNMTGVEYLEDRKRYYEDKDRDFLKLFDINMATIFA